MIARGYFFSGTESGQQQQPSSSRLKGGSVKEPSPKENHYPATSPKPQTKTAAEVVQEVKARAQSSRGIFWRLPVSLLCFDSLGLVTEEYPKNALLPLVWTLSLWVIFFIRVIIFKQVMSSQNNLFLPSLTRSVTAIIQYFCFNLCFKFWLC